MYTLECIHHRRAYVKGDLESEDLVTSQAFKTIKEANNFLKYRLLRAKEERCRVSIELHSRGSKMSSLTIFTNDTWIHENTGEEECEYYQYKLKKG